MKRSPFKPDRLTLLYDGDCPLCTREAAFLERRDRRHDRIDLIDITEEAFDPAVYGLTQEAVMGRMHAVTPGGEIVTGMEALRHAYREIGLGWLLAPTGWPLLRPLFDRLYRWFARNRIRLTGRWREEKCRDAERCGIGKTGF